MKILCFIDNLGSGGAQRQLANLAVLFLQHGYEIDFITYGNMDFFGYLLRENGIQPHVIHHRNFFDRILKVRRYLRNSDADIVLSFLETPNFLACISAIGQHRWKLITNERSSREQAFQEKRARVLKYFEKYSDQIVCNSENAKKMWEHYYPQFSQKLRTIYNAVQVSCTHKEPAHHKDGKRHIIVAASYQYIKNPIGLIEAVHLLPDEMRSRLVIDWYGEAEIVPGNTGAYDEAVQLVGRYQIETSVNLNGTTTDIHAKMQEADVVGLFSRYEGLPNAVCEGMLLGKPIMMTKVSDYETLVDETTGFLCEPDPESIKQSLINMLLLSDNDLLQMGNASKIKAKRLFEPDLIAGQWIELFNNLLKHDNEVIYINKLKD